MKFGFLLFFISVVGLAQKSTNVTSSPAKPGAPSSATNSTKAAPTPAPVAATPTAKPEFADRIKVESVYRECFLGNLFFNLSQTATEQLNLSPADKQKLGTDVYWDVMQFHADWYASHGVTKKDVDYVFNALNSPEGKQACQVFSVKFPRAAIKAAALGAKVKTDFGAPTEKQMNVFMEITRANHWFVQVMGLLYNPKYASMEPKDKKEIDANVTRAIANGFLSVGLATKKMPTLLISLTDSRSLAFFKAYASFSEKYGVKYIKEFTDRRYKAMPQGAPAKK